MQVAQSTDKLLGYCTNVHAGPTLAQTKANLETHALAVKERVCPDTPMGVGLWLAQPAARELIDSDGVGAFADWLSDRGLLPFTFNGFPFGDFHETVVKQKVYHPNWTTRDRLDYTVTLAQIQVRLLRDTPLTEGGISTLPIGWRSDIADSPGSPSSIEITAGHLLELVDALASIEADTGTLIHVDIEPEPGCYLDTSDDVVRLFNDHLLPQCKDASLVRRHLRVCHDICHAAVMFESQADMIANYDAAGIAIGKVQVSCAVRAAFDSADPAERRAMLAQLRQFEEPRYLHQTVSRDTSDNTTFYTDLPGALATCDDDAPPTDEWRTHFHVPLFLGKFGQLESTQEQVRQCLALLRDRDDVRHYEAETYAWDVLPNDLKAETLADGIARELRWLIDAMEAAR